MTKKKTQHVGVENIEQITDSINESAANTKEAIDSLKGAKMPHITQNGGGNMVVIQNGDNSIVSSNEQQLELLKKMMREQKECSDRAINEIDKALTLAMDALNATREALKSRADEIALLKRLLKENGIDI